ncbi:MAG: hypothetical protein PHV20_01400 [Bacteroidales bacterium]|nr:hypothetical protein [Bacteroidales bacterium]
MKHIFLFITLCTTSFSLQATNFHALSASRNAYRAADQITKQQVEYKEPGTAGLGKVWDFSTVQPINEAYTLDYFIPDSTDMLRLCGMEHNTRYYYRQQADSVWGVGYENNTTTMEYTRPELRMRFPFAYGDTLRSDFEGVGQYGHFMALNVKGTTRVEADASGELRLPQNETVKKALRVHTLRHYTQTGKDSVEMTLDTYSWYAAGIRYPVFESIRTTINKKGNSSDTTLFTTSFYYPPEKQVSQIETEPIPLDSLYEDEGAAGVFTEATLYPNPVVSNLVIKYKLTRQANIWFSVHNSMGVQFSSTSPEALEAGEHRTIVPMGSLNHGAYLIYVHVDDMLLRRGVMKK